MGKLNNLVIEDGIPPPVDWATTRGNRSGTYGMLNFLRSMKINQSFQVEVKNKDDEKNFNALRNIMYNMKKSKFYPFVFTTRLIEEDVNTDARTYRVWRVE